MTTTRELDIRLYDKMGKRKRLPQNFITEAQFEVGERGGFQNGSLTVLAGWDALGFEGTEFVDIYAFDDRVYRGYALQPQQSLEDAEKWTINLYGLMDRLNGYLVRHCYCYASPTNIAEVFEDVVVEYVVLAGRLPNLVLDTTGVSALGIKLTEFCAKGKSVSQAFNQLIDMAPQQLIWGCDVDSNGDDRLYLRPRSEEVAYRYSVGKDVNAFVYPRDVTQVVNKVYVSGGSADPANLAPNASFENCSSVDDNKNNLFTNAGFEDVDATYGLYATGWSQPGSSSTGAKVYVYPNVGGANLSHAGNAWVVLDYYSFASMQPSANTLSQTVQIGFPQRVRVAAWARQKTADGNTSEYRDFRIKVQAKDATGVVMETFTSATITPDTANWVQYSFECTPTNQSVTQITVTFEQVTLFVGNQDTYHLLLDDATCVVSQVTADGWRVGTSSDAFLSTLDWRDDTHAYEGSFALKAQATITGVGGYTEICTRTDKAIDVQPGKTYYFTAWLLSEGTTAPQIRLGLRQFSDSTQLQEDMGATQTLPTTATWTRYEFSVTVGQNCNKLEPFVRFLNEGVVYLDAVMVTQGTSVPQSVFYTGNTFEAVRSVTDYTSGDIGTEAAGSISTYGIREKEESVEHIRDLDSLDAYCKSYFRAHAVPAVQAKLTLKGITATLGLAGKVKLLNLPDAPEPLFPSRIRYRVGESFDAEIDLNNERPDLANLLRKLTANVPKGTTGTAVASSGGSTSRAGSGAVLTVAADAGSGLVGNVALTSGRTAVLTQNGQSINVDVRGRSVSDLATLPAEANAIVFIADANRGGFFRAFQTGNSPNNGTTFASATSGWVWERVFQGDYNALWFGVVGDGSTDDTSALQAAMTATPNGGTLILPKPSQFYKITAYLNVLGSLTLRGSTDGVEIRQATTDQGCFNVLHNDVIIERLTLTGKQYVKYRPWNGGENAIKANGNANTDRLNNLTIRHCTIQNWGSIGVQVQFVDSVRVENCLLQNLNEAGVQAVCCNHGWVTGCTIKNIVGDATGDATASPPIGVNTSVYGVVITRTGSSDTTNEPRSTYWNVANNRIQDVVWEALDTHGGQYITFADNVITNCYGAIVVNYAQESGGTELLAPKDITVCGNVISGRSDGSCTFGISITGAQNGTTVAEYAERIAITGNTIYGHGNQSLQNSGAVYCRTTMGLVVASNTLIEPACCGIVLSHENRHYTVTGNNIVDCWSNTVGNVGMGIRIYAASSVGNNTGTISSNNFGRDAVTGKSSVVSVCNRAIEVGNYSGNEAQIGLNRYDSVFTYKVLDAGSLAATTFNLQVKLPTNGSAGGLLIGDEVRVYRNAANQLTITSDLIGSPVQSVGLRQLEGFCVGGFNEYDTAKSVFNYSRNRMVFLESVGGSTALTPSASAGISADLYKDTGNPLTWNSPSGTIQVRVNLPTAWSYMRELLLSQHVLYFARQVVVEYSTDNGSTWTTYTTYTNLKGGDNALVTSTALYGTTNLRLTFSDFASGTYFQLLQVGWTYYNAPLSPYGVSRGGDTVFGNLDLNANVASTFYTTANRRVRLNATSTSDVLAYEMSENSGEGKRSRLAMTGSGSSSLLTLETDASSSTNRPNVSIRSGSTEWLGVTTKGTNAGRVTLGSGGANAGLMIVDALLYRDSASVLRTSGSLTVDATFKHSGTSLGFFNKTPTTQQTGGASTAGATYTTTEQNMIQKAYDCLRTFGLLT
jgi:hypothetical protein